MDKSGDYKNNSATSKRSTNRKTTQLLTCKENTNISNKWSPNCNKDQNNLHK